MATTAVAEAETKEFWEIIVTTFCLSALDSLVESKNVFKLSTYKIVSVDDTLLIKYDTGKIFGSWT